MNETEKNQLARYEEKVRTCEMQLKKQYAQINTYERVIDHIIGNIKRSINTQEVNKAHHEKGSYEFIPRHTYSLFGVFQNLRDYLLTEGGLKEIDLSPYSSESNPVRFLDAGCGIGNVLVMAAVMGLGNVYHGLELFEETAAMADIFTGALRRPGWSDPNFKIERRDILTYRDYRNYDFIYYFHPFTDSAKECVFEKRIEDQMKVGAILIPLMKGDYSIRRDKRFKRLPLGSYEYIYQKVEK